MKENQQENTQNAPLSPIEDMRQRIQELEENSYFTNPPRNITFNEYDYSKFDADAVRPQHVAINEKLHNTAIAHEADIRPSDLPENDLYHRAAIHSERSLPQTEERKNEFSESAAQRRSLNVETAKIVDSEHLVQKMTCSDDAIAYFARTPDKATVKLVFCKPVNSQVDVDYNPYELQVISKKETETLPLYYTISQNGVMRIVNEKVAEKLDFSAEMREIRRDNDISESEQRSIMEHNNENGAKIIVPARAKVILKKPLPLNEDDQLEILLEPKEPEMTDEYALTDKINPLNPFIEDSTEFVELDRWILESSSFKILKNFKFFREFYARKSLENWISFKNYKKFCRVRAFEEYNLFTAKEHFLKCLEVLNSQYYIISNSLIIDSFATFDFTEENTAKSTATPTSTLKAWNDAQSRVESHMQLQMETCTENMLNAILQLCDNLQEKASDRTDEENAKLPLFLKQKLLKQKSITQTKAEQLEKRKCVKTAQEELKQICKLIKLADQQFVESLLQMLESSTMTLSNCLNSDKEVRPGTSNGLIQSQLGFNTQNQLYFEPSLDSIEESILSAIENSIEISNKPTMLQKFESLKEFFILGNMEPKNQNILQVAENDEVFEETKLQIQRFMQEQAQELEEKAQDYKELREMFEFEQSFDEELYINRNSSLSCCIADLLPSEYLEYFASPPPAEILESVESSIEEARNRYGTRPLEKEIAKFRAWETLLGKEAPAIASGFAELDARKLLQELQPVPIIGLKAVENTALAVLREIIKTSGEKIAAHTKAISQQPSELEAYSAFILYLKTVDVDLVNFEEKAQLCDDLLQLLASQNIISCQLPQQLWTTFKKQSFDEMSVIDSKLNPQIIGLGSKIDLKDRSDLESLHTNLQILEEKRMQAENFALEVHESQINGMTTRLETIKKSTLDVEEEIVSGPSSDQNAEPTQVILNLKELINKVDSLEKDNTQLQQHFSVVNEWHQNSKKGADSSNAMDENLKSCKEKIEGYQADLNTRLQLWERLNEWKIFEEYILYDPWITICLVGQKDQDAEEEENEPEKEQIETKEEQEQDGEMQILLRFKEMNVDASMSFVGDCLKEANKFTRQLNNDEVAVYFKQIVTEMRHKSQLLLDLGNTAMDDLHWQEIFDLIDGEQFSYTSEFTLFNLMKAGILNKKNEISMISTRATGEHNLKQEVKAIQTQWDQTKFKCKDYAARSNANSIILTGIDDMYEQLDDSLALVQSMASSRFIAGIRDEVLNLEKKLLCFEDVLDEWVKCQQSWLYLESIFAPQDIKNQLPVEFELFEEVDKFWHGLLETAKETKSVLDVVQDDFKTPNSQEGLLITLEMHNESLEKVQKRLEDYLETKRLAFPRFYFISNDELLQILAETTDVSTVRPFLRKIFEALSDFTIQKEEDGTVLLQDMISPEGEVVEFEQPVKPEGGLVEVWLNALEKQMFNTLRIKQMKAIEKQPVYGSSRKEWIFEHPAQCILASGQVIYVNAVEKALLTDAQLGTRYNMELVHETMIEQIDELTEMIVETKDSIKRAVITPLIVIEVYARDVCADLLDERSTNHSILPSDFGWEKELKHYWIPKEQSTQNIKLQNTGVGKDNIASGDLVFKQTDFVFTSGYEYYGVNSRLVVTPLTTKCYLTLTSALRFNFGGAPEGPAGTGKTETCKDLIKTIQVSCLIFNCSDGLDYKSMAKFFCGLAMSGSYSVFDEFNRILIDELSVISQQILTILNAVRAKVQYFAFQQHTELPINTRVGFFITMNPGYAGRTELPDSIKALMRPIAMVVPDYALIAENFLFSEGYKNGKTLARKMTQLYKLSSEQLSHQFHYDFGMRAIKSILYMAGKLKQNSSGSESEDKLLVRAMLDSNIPKFLADDIVLFNGIVQDLFPGFEIQNNDYGALEVEIRKVLCQKGLQADKEFVSKILQVYDTHIIRHGMMFVGNTLTGKTVAREVLSQAITNLAGTSAEFLPVKERVLSATSMSVAELYGELNKVTNEWTDGLIAVLVRQMAQEEGVKTFLIADSIITSLWIESLNSVLDDSKLLSLANGERIRINDRTTFMFESSDLSQASPATVSRCGMVYFSQSFLSVASIFRSETLDNVDFMKRMLELVVFEEFNLNLQELREKAADLIEKKIFDDETETPTPEQHEKEVDRMQLLLLNTYPHELGHFANFEKVSLFMATEVVKKLLKQFTTIFIPLIKKYREQYQEELETSDFEEVINIVHILDSLISERIAFSKNKLKEEQDKAAKLAKQQLDTGGEEPEQLSAEEDFNRHIPDQQELDEREVTGLAPITSILMDERYIFALTWGLGGSLKSEYEQQFDSDVKGLMRSDRNDLTEDQQAALMSLQNNLPPEQAIGSTQKLNLFDWKIDNANRYYIEWNPKSTIFGSDKFNYNIILSGGSIYDMIVPTQEFVKLCSVTQSLIRNNNNVYLCGSTGTSKTSIIKSVFARTIGAEQKETEQKGETEEEEENAFDSTEENSLLDASIEEFPFSAETKAIAVENAIFEKLDKKRKNFFAPPNNRKQHYIFIDDADMPAPDQFSVEAPNELIRQLMFESGCYDRQKLEFKQVENILFIFASEEAGAGRNHIDPRLSSKFASLACPELTNVEMNYIFSNLLSGYFNQVIAGSEFSHEIKNLVNIIVTSAVDIYNLIKKNIRATPSKSHYSFNLRDIARVIGGIFSARPEELQQMGQIITLLMHEQNRVFRDRLVDQQDEQAYDEIQVKTMVSYFYPVYEKSLKDAEQEQNTEKDEIVEEKDEYEEETESEEEVIVEKADPLNYGQSVEELLAKLQEITNCSLDDENLMYGRWTNESGVTTDIAPYKNITLCEEERNNALKSILNSMYDEQEEQHYDQIDYEELLHQSNEEANLRLVLFKDAISHFSRMFRVFQQPAGHMLCIGLSGSGRKSLLRLVAEQLDTQIVEPTASKLYGLNELYEDIKKCLLQTADQGDKFKPIILLLTETSLDPEGSFLEIINGIINGIPLPMSVWKKDEVEKVKDIALMITAKVEQENNDKKKDYTSQELWDVFYRTARANFHICLCFSPVGDALRIRLRQFPALVNCTTIDWYSLWNEQALLEVGKEFLRQVHPALLDKYSIEQLAATCVEIHSASQAYAAKYQQKTKERIYVTPPMFISFLQLFKSILEKSVGSMKQRHEILSKGLTKLTDTSKQVEEMKTQLKELQPVLAESVEATEQLLQKLSVDQETASKIRETVEKEGKEVAKMVASAQEIKDDVQADLEEAMPAYLAAMKALQNFDKNSVTELKSFKEPPIAVKEALEAVCVLFETQKADWDTALHLVSEMNFLNRVMNFDKDNIKPKTLRLLRKYTENPDFTLEKVENSSKAAKCLFEWCEAMDVYAKVAAEVQPKREKLQAAEEELRKQEEAFDIKQKELNEVEAKLESLEQQYNESVEKRTNLEKEIKDTETRLQRAEKLVDGLSNEHESWKQEIQQIVENMKSSVGDALIASAIIAYLSPYTSDDREKIIMEWKEKIFITSAEGEQGNKVLVEKQFKLENFSATADPREIRKWKQKCQLPGDGGSIENAIIVTSSIRYPFMIDPELEGLNWLKKMLENRKIVGQHIETMARDLENAITTGEKFIVENATTDLDATLSSVLRKEVARNYIKVGDKQVLLNNQFGLYITSRMRKIDLSPDIQAAASVVNMSVSSEGLEEQLLSLILQVEDPESELLRDEATSRLADAKEEEQKQQDIVLEMLANSKGNILDDESLIDALEQSKDVTEKIVSTIEECETTAKNTNLKREMFRNVAIRGRILYEAVAGLSALDPMYMYSIDFFKNLFTKTLQNIEEGPNKQLEMIEAVTKTIFMAVSRGIFEKHKPIFAFMIATGIEREDGKLSQKLWDMFSNNYLLKNEKDPQAESVFYDTLEEYLSLKQINYIYALSILSGIHDDLLKILEERPQGFIDYCMYEEIETFDAYQFADEHVVELLEQLSNFELLVLRYIINEKRLIFYLPIYTLSVMKEEMFVSSSNYAIEEVFKDCNAITPLVFILSSGSDPMIMIQQYVHSQQKMEKFFTLALGEGEGVIADEYIERAAINGEWVCLENCHLCSSWMPELQKHVENIKDLYLAGKLNPEFRLILTSMPSKVFPGSVLAQSIKVSNEPPRGVKSNMLTCYEVMTADYHDNFEVPELQKHWQRSLFALSYFYALLIQRKKFGPICYNSKYDFTVQDLIISEKFMSQYLIDQYNVKFKGKSDASFDGITEIIPYQPLCYMIGSIAFGGRISDALDTRCVDTIMAQLLNKDLFNARKQLSAENEQFVAPDYSYSRKQVMSYIENEMPQNEPTSLFGLHANAELTYQQAESQQIIASVLLMKPADLGNSENTVQMLDQKVLLGAEEIVKNLPQSLDANGIAMTSTIHLQSGLAMPSPFASILKQECERYNQLLDRLRQLFTDVELAITGQAIMSPELDEIYNAVLKNQLPKVIINASYPSLKNLSNYFDDLAKRVKFFSDWIQMKPEQNSPVKELYEQNYNAEIEKAVFGQLDGYMPKEFWLGAFYFPHGLFTSILQHHARMYSLSIDQLEFETIPLSDADKLLMSDKLCDGLVMTGLKSEGCRWNTSKKIIDESEFGEILSDLPVIWFKPVVSLDTNQQYALPLYTTTNRFGVLTTTGLSSNYIMNLHLDSEKPESWWVMRGAAAFIQDSL